MSREAQPLHRGTDPRHPDDLGLRRAMQRRLPLIYLFGVVPGQYMPVWPVYVVGDEPATLSFLVSVDDQQHALPAAGEDSRVAEARRGYVTVVTQRRLHQQTFRQRVLRAYQERCAICRLRHRELLEAAHILPDGDPRGSPSSPTASRFASSTMRPSIATSWASVRISWWTFGWMSCARRTGPCSSTGCRGSRAYGSRFLTISASSRIVSGSPSDTRSSRGRVDPATLGGG